MAYERENSKCTHLSNKISVALYIIVSKGRIEKLDNAEGTEVNNLGKNIERILRNKNTVQREILSSLLIFALIWSRHFDTKLHLIFKFYVMINC